MAKTVVVLIFGGKSAEHEVSLRSAANIFRALDSDKYDALPVYVDRKGAWILRDRQTMSSGVMDQPQKRQRVFLAPDENRSACLIFPDGGISRKVDVAFPIIHGTGGEDGSLQGFFETLNLPYVGAGVAGSAIGMDKELAKRLLEDNGIATAPYAVFTSAEKALNAYKDIVARLGKNLFIKPATLGSSVGVNRVGDFSAYRKAAQTAFAYDSKILVEQEIEAREIECAVLGGSRARAAVPGEISVADNFYSYEQKYLADSRAVLRIPANLSASLTEKIQGLSIRAFKALNCYGMARVDFFLLPDEKLLVNEINTLPGFTEISMYPKMWRASGLEYGGLLDELIRLAFARQKKKKTHPL